MAYGWQHAVTTSLTYTAGWCQVLHWQWRVERIM
jgi:hypothetical protein